MMDRPAEKKTNETIFKDVTRTFPKHLLFKEKYGVGQKSLYNVCKALANYQSDTGYVQGMSYIVATLLTHMDQEDAFSALVCLMKNAGWKNFFLPKMPGLSKAFYVLLSLIKKFMPEVHQHFIDNNFQPSMYAS